MCGDLSTPKNVIGSGASGFDCFAHDQRGESIGHLTLIVVCREMPRDTIRDVLLEGVCRIEHPRVYVAIRLAELPSTGLGQVGLRQECVCSGLQAPLAQGRPRGGRQDDDWNVFRALVAAEVKNQVDAIRGAVKPKLGDDDCGIRGGRERIGGIRNSERAAGIAHVTPHALRHSMVGPLLPVCASTHAPVCGPVRSGATDSTAGSSS
jgi:hypothetical protein